MDGQGGVVVKEYYSAMKKQVTLPFPTTQMDLEGIMLHETSQTKKEQTLL